MAAAPDKLLPLAARTVTAELDTAITRPRLLSLKNALAEQAQQPDADPRGQLGAEPSGQSA